MMKTLHLDLECGVCKEHRNRKREALMCIVDENITDNITSYLTCHCCSEILEYEKIYNKGKYNKLCKAEKQIHCILNCVDKSYQKLENNKKRKEYLKKYSRSHDNASKLLMKKLINDTNMFYMLDSYKRNFILNTMGYFGFQYADRMKETITYRTCYEDYVVTVFKKITCDIHRISHTLAEKNYLSHTTHVYSRSKTMMIIILLMMLLIV